MKKRATPALAAMLVAANGCLAAEPLRLSELVDLDLEQLARITVTSASKREERVLDAPASIFVVTAEDIRRSGATSLPEALRLAPNLQVMRPDTAQYLANARGGASGLANKMLVLIDGRTVYSPLFSGVFWDAQIVPLADVERIEVISGPGSTLWGTNAVNGVINITTRAAARTLGSRLEVGGGDRERGATARFGARAAGNGDYRVYGHYYDRDAHQLESGASAQDQVDRWQAGFRADWETAARSATLQGDLYSGHVDNLGGARTLSGGNLLGRWAVRPSAGSEMALRAYYDRTEREHLGSFQEVRDTLDIEYLHSWTPSPAQRIVWGAGYRASRDRTSNTPALGFSPADRTLEFTNLFVQDEIVLSPRLKATLGLRAERNSYTGVEWLPNARLAFAPTPNHLLWTALTHTVRAPARIDRDLMVPGMPPLVVAPNDTFESEVANVVEVGYRARVAPGATVSFTAFHHEYRDLRTLEPGAAGLVLANGARGRRSGLEGWGDWAVTPEWRLIWGFVAMDSRFAVEPGRVDLGGGGNGNDPERTAQLRSHWNVTRAHELDLAVRYMGPLPQPRVPAHTVLDVRLGWRLSPRVALSLLVANALDRRHIEFATPAQAAQLERTWFLKATFEL